MIRTTTGNSRGWKSDSEDEGTSNLPTVEHNIVPAKDEVIPLANNKIQCVSEDYEASVPVLSSPESHDGDGNEAAELLPSNPLSQNQGTGDNCQPEDGRQIITGQEMVELILNAPWGPEEHLMDMIAKFKIAPRQ